MSTTSFLNWLSQYLSSIDRLDSNLLTIKNELDLLLTHKKKKIKYSPSYLSCLIDLEEIDDKENKSELVPF